MREDENGDKCFAVDDEASDVGFSRGGGKSLAI